MGFAEGAQSLLDQGRIGQHPAVQGGVVHRKAALEEQLLDVTVAQGIAQVPRDRLQDQRRLEVPALEVTFGATLQLLGNRTQDYGPPPTSEGQNPRASLTSRKQQNFATGPAEPRSKPCSAGDPKRQHSRPKNRGHPACSL